MGVQHKPAPWRVEDASNPDCPFFYVRDAEGHFVVLICDSEDWGHAVLKAHAHLIAASPELLAACEAMVAIRDTQRKRESEEFHLGADSFMAMWDEAEKECIAAIAKAKGQSA